MLLRSQPYKAETVTHDAEAKTQEAEAEANTHETKTHEAEAMFFGLKAEVRPRGLTSLARLP